MTGHHMIVHHPDSLHEGVDDGWAAELEPRLFQVLGNLPRQGCLGRHLGQ